MTEYLDSLHDGQFFIGKQVVTTTKKIQVLSLSGNTNHPEFILYHSNEPSHELFYPFVSSKSFEVVLPRKNAKTQFKVQEFNNLFYLYLNGELVHYHTQYFDKLFLDSKSPAILTDTTYYQITQEYADSYNVIHKLISQTQQQEEETQQELTQEEVEQIELQEETTQEVIVELQQTDVEQTQEETTQEVIVELQQTDVEQTQEETTQEVIVELQQTEVKQTQEETTQEIVIEIQVEEPVQEVVVEIQQEDIQIQVEEPVQEVVVEMQQEDIQIQEESTQEVVVEMQQEDIQIQEPVQVEESNQEVVVEIQQEDIQEIKVEEPVQEIVVEMKEEVEQIENKEIKKSVSFEEDMRQNDTMNEILQDFQNVSVSVQEPQKATIHMIDFHHLNRNYKIPCLKLDASNQLNFKQIHQEVISVNNNIEQENISIHVPEMNQYYLIQFKRTKFLLYRMNQTLIITNIQTKNSKIVKNKEMVRILSYNFILTNHASLLVPMEQKRFFDNHYGTTVSTFVPRT
jgi:hypothetical protein